MSAYTTQPAKRFKQQLRSPSPSCAPRIDFATQLSEEVILLILSHLHYQDLAHLSRASREWRRLASDQTLWKSLFVKRFSNLSLPVAAEGEHGEAETSVDRSQRRRRSGQAALIMRDQHDWQTMFVLQHNWSSGNCHIQSLRIEATGPPRPVLAFSKNFVLVASEGPLISVWCIENRRRVGTLPCGRLPAASVATCILVDTSLPATQRVLAGFSDGSCRIWSLSSKDSGGFAADELCTIRGQSSDESILAVAICDIVVVVCTAQFDLVFYRLIPPSEPGRLWTSKELNRVGWHSRNFWAPVDLHLLQAGAGTSFSLHVAYESPTATGNWQVGLELINFSTENAKVTTQHYSPSNSKMLPKSASPLTCLRFRAPYLVTAHADNVVQLYMMMPSPTRRKPQRTALVHISPLYAHSAAVTALDLDAASGKLVTAGFDGTKIWELQLNSDGSVKIPEPTVTLVDGETAAQWGAGGEQYTARTVPLWLGFDAGRIVSCNGRGREIVPEKCEPVVKIFSFLDE